MAIARHARNAVNDVTAAAGQKATLAAGAGGYAARKLAPSAIQSEVDEVSRAAQARQTQTVIAGIVIGAALLIGFFVVSTIDDALNLGNDPDTSLDEDKNSTLDRIGDGLLIGGVIIIVLMAAVILRVLRGL